jgi:predicted NACHT family NTPase
LAFDETLAFPARQVDLYKEAIDALLKKWDTSRLIVRDSFYKNLSYIRREHLLEHLASHFYFLSKNAFARDALRAAVRDFLRGLPDIDVGYDADADGVIRAIEAQHGLIVERAAGIYSFSHLTVQEYLTASHIIKDRSEAKQRQIVKSSLTDPKWREVTIYTVGLLPSADDFLREMVGQLSAMPRHASKLPRQPFPLLKLLFVFAMQ